VNSIPIIPSVTNNSRIQVFNLKPHSGGTLNLDNRATTYYNGGADAYSLTPAATAPVAGFTGTPTTGSRPLTVQFTDTSTNTPTSWLWNFGDTSFENYTVRNPQHTFANAGDYTITLTATNSAGSDSYTRTNYISVNSVTPPVAGFSGTPTTGVRPLSVRFTDSSTNAPTSWLWNFGDGNTTGNTLQNPAHLYVLPGTYTVILTATNAGGSNTLTRTNYITVNEIPPVADFSGTPRSGVEPLTVSFTDLSTNSPTSWLWNFGDGTTSTEQNPTHQYTTDGRYRVILTATNSAGSDTESKNNYITVEQFTADFSYTYEEVPIFPPFWYGYEVDFTGTSNGAPTSWSWNFDGGSGSTTVQNPQDVFYWFGGNFDVTLTVTNSVGTTATVTKRVRLT
jgi:PKD repeat protein